MNEVSKKSKEIKKGQGREENKEKNMERSRVRSGSVIRELILSNNLCYHWVLTFADEVTDREVVLSEFKKFIQRLNYFLSEKFLYVAVMEVQEKRARKFGVEVWHLHMATDVYIKHGDMMDIWKNGIVNVKKHENGVEGVAGYLTKYLKKDMAKYEVFNKKRFFCSKGLKRAEVKKGFVSKEILEKIKEESQVHVEYEAMGWFKVELDKLNFGSEGV